MDHAETVAKRVLESVIPHGCMIYHDKQPKGECDFSLNQNGLTIAAVEVTSAIDQVHTATIAAIRGKRGRGPIIHASECKKSWAIFPSRDARIDNIRNNVERYLSQLEECGIEKFFFIRNDEQCVQDLCRDLRIISGSTISLDGPPRIFIKLPMMGGAVGPSVAVEAGEKEAWKKDNRKKLGAANTNERYLVVYIDVLNGGTWTALTDFDPPRNVAHLPTEITRLWLVGHRGQAVNEFVVWHASSKEPWQRIEVQTP